MSLTLLGNGCSVKTGSKVAAFCQPMKNYLERDSNITPMLFYVKIICCKDDNQTVME